MNNPEKSETTGVRLRPLLKDYLPTAVRLRGLTSISEYFRLMIVNDYISLGLMEPMTDEEKTIEVKR